jgi:hypothetical protein
LNRRGREGRRARPFGNAVRGSASSAERTVSGTLQTYADRGVFRGFSAAPGARGRIDYRFTWLTRQPMSVSFDPDAGVISFPRLFPDAASRGRMVDDLHGLVAGRHSRGLPAHKRVDLRRARLTSRLRSGSWDLAVTVRGGNHEYATRLAVNLINELFLLLQERYPDYLVEQFGFSGE